MRPTRAKLLIAVISAAITVNDVKGTEPKDVKQIRALAASYLANIESFTELNCDNEIINYQPVSTEELARGTFRDDIFRGNVAPKATAGGVWIRSGSTVRRELIVDDTALGEAMKTQRIVFSPESVLVDGVDAIALNRLLKGGVLYSRRYRPEFVEHGPFDFGNVTGSEGFWNPGIVLTDRETWKDGTVELWPGPPPNEPHAFQSDVPLVGVKYSVQLGPALLFELHFWMDPSRGALPIIGFVHLECRPSQTMVVTDVRSFPGGRAFPMRSIDILHLREDDSQIGWAVETRVRTLEADSPIDPALLRIEVGDGAILRDAADDNCQFTLEKGGLMGVSDIPALMERAAAQSRQQVEWDRENKKRPALAQSPEPPENGAGNTLLYLNFGLILLLAAVLLVARIRKRRTVPDP